MTHVTIERAKLEQLLEALNSPAYGKELRELQDKAITVAKQALAAAPVQEPIGYFTVNDYDKWEQIDGTSGKPLYDHPAAQPASVQPIGYEKYAAIREGHRNASEEAYFAARPDLPLTTAMLKLFRDGFDRGYDTTQPASQGRLTHEA